METQSRLNMETGEILFLNQIEVSPVHSLNFGNPAEKELESAGVFGVGPLRKPMSLATKLSDLNFAFASTHHRHELCDTTAVSCNKST